MSSIIIVAEDVDILILCLAFQQDIDSDIYVKCGTATRPWYISIRKVSGALRQDACHALPGFRAFTGCDTASAFSGRDKLGPLRLLINSDNFKEGFSKLGSERQPINELLKI